MAKNKNTINDLQVGLERAKSAYDKEYDFPKASDLYQKLIHDAKEQKNDDVEIEAMIGLGRTMLRQNNTAQALEVFEKAIATVHQTYNQLALCSVLNGKGDALRLLNRDEEALEIFEQAIAIAKKTNNQLALCSALNGKGEALRLLSRAEESLEVFEQAIVTANQTNSQWVLCHALNSKGNALRLLNRHEEALEVFEQAIVTANQTNNQWALCHALNSKGNALRLLNRHEEALKVFEQAIVTANQTSNQSALCYALNSKGNALRLLNRYEEALEVFEQAIVTANQTSNQSALCSALIGKGEALRQLNRPTEALEVFEKAIVPSSDIRKNYDLCNALIAKAELLEVKNPLDADKTFKQAFDEGVKIDYGYAITRAQAGLRRIESSKEVRNKLPKDVSTASGKIQATVTKPQALLKVNDESESFEKLKRIFGPDVIKNLLINQSDYEKTIKSFLPEDRVWTVTLMCDIRGYTTAMAMTDPEEQLSIINAYLKRGTEIINEAGGGVDKYMGDAILGFFLPTSMQNENEHAETVKRALNAACKIAEDATLLNLFNEFASRYKNIDDSNFGVGIGLAAGWAKFGSIGAPHRQEYTMIGRPVNLVARVQAIAKPWQVLSTRECWNKYSPIKNFTDIFELIEVLGLEELKGYEHESVLEVKRIKAK